MNGEMEVFEAMGAPAFEPYDPFSGWTPSAIAGGPAKHFPVEAYAPEPDWLSSLAAPWESFGQNFWETGGEVIQTGSKVLPEVLWKRGLQEVGLLPKQRVVDEGAGITVIHSQAPRAGGIPAQPIIPGRLPYYTPMVGAPPQAVGTSAVILIGAGLLILIILFK